MPTPKLKSLVDQHLPQFKKETLFLTGVPPPQSKAIKIVGWLGLGGSWFVFNGNLKKNSVL